MMYWAVNAAAAAGACKKARESNRISATDTHTNSLARTFIPRQTVSLLRDCDREKEVWARVSGEREETRMMRWEGEEDRSRGPPK